MAYNQHSLNSNQLVFLDESAAKTNMTRSYGRAQKGKRCYGNAPDSRWQTITMLSSIKLNGETTSFVYQGGTTKTIFEIYLEKILCPTLQEGDIIVMDNYSSHKGLKIQELIENCGARIMYLPAYSPDFNPIEKMWSKIKAYLRKCEARTFDELVNVIGEAHNLVTASDTQGWFKSCGYNC